MEHTALPTLYNDMEENVLYYHIDYNTPRYQSTNGLIDMYVKRKDSDGNYRLYLFVIVEREKMKELTDEKVRMFLNQIDYPQDDNGLPSNVTMVYFHFMSNTAPFR